jgi:hypothetical protein
MEMEERYQLSGWKSTAVTGAVGGSTDAGLSL